MNKSDESLPDVIRIESVGLCNFNCVHCPTGIRPNNRSILKPEQFQLILDQFAAKNFIPRVVVLYHGGEPLVNKHLEDYIFTLKQLGVEKTVITTNGSLLNEKRARKLLDAGLDEMKVSFDGDSPEENDRIRVNANFHKDAKNVLEFLRLRHESAKKTPEVIISNTRISDERSLMKLESQGDEALPDVPFYLREYFKTYLEEVRFQSYPAMAWPNSDLYENRVLDYTEKNPTHCTPLFETFSILSTGEVVSCCYDLRGEKVFGNVFETDIFDIWESQEYQTFRSDFRQKKYSDLCKGCVKVIPRFLVKK